MLHGHCHGSIDLQNSAELPDHIRIDVGIDSSFANYDFVSVDKLANFIKKLYKTMNTLNYISKGLRKALAFPFKLVNSNFFIAFGHKRKTISRKSNITNDVEEKK